MNLLGPVYFNLLILNKLFLITTVTVMIDILITPTSVPNIIVFKYQLLKCYKHFAHWHQAKIEVKGACCALLSLWSVR